MSDTQVQVSLPAEAAALSQGLQKLFLAAVANHKAGGGAAVEVAADLTAAIQDLGPALAGAGLLGDEIKAEPIGVAQAFADAGFGVARTLLNK